MKLYTDLNIPLYRWIQIEESQNNGEIDFRYLKVGKLPKRYNKKKYSKAYLNILYQIPDMESPLTLAWAKYAGLYIKYCTQLEMNNWSKLWKKKEIKIQVNELNRAFNEYLDNLQEENKDFKIKIYGLKRNYRELWDLEIEIPEQLKEKDNFQYILQEEYNQMVREWTESNKITLYEAVYLMVPAFINRFIEEKEVKISDIKEVNTRLYNFFRDNGNIEKWRHIRGDLFHLDKLGFETKKKSNISKHVKKLSEINTPILLHGENAATLKDYFEHIEIVKEKEKERKQREKERKHG